MTDVKVEASLSLGKVEVGRWSKSKGIDVERKDLLRSMMKDSRCQRPEQTNVEWEDKLEFEQVKGSRPGRVELRQIGIRVLNERKIWRFQSD